MDKKVSHMKTYAKTAASGCCDEIFNDIFADHWNNLRVQLLNLALP